MSAKDKRIVFVKKGVVDFEEFELGEPQENEVLVAVKAQLLNAGTELAYLAGITKAIEDGEMTYPIRPGGSNAGEVIQVGKGVTDLKAGDRVLGTGRHAARAVFRRDALLRIPEGLSFEEAAFADLCCVGMQGIRIGRPELGEVVVVIGAGIIGALALQFARICGAGMVVAVDLSPMRLKMARELGADEAINPSETDVLDAVRRLTDGEMAPVLSNNESAQRSTTGHPLRRTVCRHGRGAALAHRPTPFDGAPARPGGGRHQRRVGNSRVHTLPPSRKAQTRRTGSGAPRVHFSLVHSQHGSAAGVDGLPLCGVLHAQPGD